MTVQVSSQPGPRNPTGPGQPEHAAQELVGGPDEHHRQHVSAHHERVAAAPMHARAQLRMRTLERKSKRAGTAPTPNELAPERVTWHRHACLLGLVGDRNGTIVPRAHGMPACHRFVDA
jgi:hypothetical protein